MKKTRDARTKADPPVTCDPASVLLMLISLDHFYLLYVGQNIDHGFLYFGPMVPISFSICICVILVDAR